MTTPRVIARAPGRVNLIGEHTDYNDGYVLPMALPFHTTIEASARLDRTVTLASDGFGRTSFELDNDPSDCVLWARYVSGMTAMLEEVGVSVRGFDASISTTIPIGASLSSSAALEVATGFALSALAGTTPDPMLIAQLGQRVENEIIGVPSGIMDQLISAIATNGAATLIDCRDLSVEPARLPADCEVLIMDTTTRRELVDSEFGVRRASCEQAAAALGLKSLRDATLAQVEELTDSIARRRARHVVSENQRVLAAVEAMRKGDPETVGALMNRSHESLATDYEVSSEALDAISSIARDQPGCFGARLTGGGFAGCAVALVERDRCAAIVEAIRSGFEEACGKKPVLWAVKPASGATVARVDS